jgi:response regulator RpfG family c-di-GMP phosphodiesterase
MYNIFLLSNGDRASAAGIGCQMTKKTDRDRPRILVVDDERSIRDSITAYLRHTGYHVSTCADGESALETFRSDCCPLVLTDLMMPGITGHELLIKIKKIDATVEVIVMTGYGTIDSAVSSIRAGAYDYIVKPFKMEALCHVLDKAQAHRNLVRENRRLQENSLNVLRAMVNVLEQRDTYTAGHSQRVTEIAMSIGRGLEISEEDLKVLRLAGPIHDIGKIGIEDNILRKPGRLTKEEYEVIKSHPEKGRQIIEPLDFLRETIPIILHHHERFDGAGYPTGLAGLEIPLGARVIAVADTFDAMTSSRAYRDARETQVAISELIRCRKTQFDPEVVDKFLELHEASDFNAGRESEGERTAR